MSPSPRNGGSPSRAAAAPPGLLVDPRPALRATGDPALTWAVGHDLDDESLDPRELWELAPVLRVTRRQTADGSWAYPAAGRVRSAEDYAQLQTYKELLALVGKYRLDLRHPALAAGAEFLLAHQSGEGDIRGIYGGQYTPNYTAAMLALMIDAGLGGDPRVRRGLDWLLDTRQEDGGWVVPLRTMRGASGSAYARALGLPEPVMPDRARASSHLVTGVVLRALVAHRGYRGRPETMAAAALLASRFFLADAYPDRRAASFWTKLQFPFRWTDLVSGLDATGLAGLPAEAPGVGVAIDWLVAHQDGEGLWRSAYASGANPLANQWVSLAAARALRRYGVVCRRPARPAARSRDPVFAS